MNSISAYATVQYNTSSYIMYEYSAGLFGLVSASDSYRQYYSSAPTTTITNINLRNVSVSGSYAGALIAESICSTSISNVKVHSGSVNGSSVAGGIIGMVGNDTQFPKASAVYISGCMNNARISARVVGGLIGFVGNLSNYYQNCTTSLVIYNSVSRGDILGFGDDVYTSSNYYAVYMGGLVGVLANKSTTLINNIVLSDLTGFTSGYAGGLIGSTSYAQTNSSSDVTISSDSNKVVGTITFKFDTDSEYSGSYLGAVLTNASSSLSITDSNTSSTIDASFTGYEGKSYSDYLGNEEIGDPEIIN